MAGDISNNENNWSYFNPSMSNQSGIPEVIGNRYEVLELIGRGNFSRIYRAHDQTLDRTVAVKFLREEYSLDENLVTRFYREARSVASLSSPYIVMVYDYGEQDTTYYIIMEYVEGRNLKELLRREPMPPRRSIIIASQVLMALATAHAEGIIHRDVKPQNILIRARDGLAKLADFGVAHVPDNFNLTTSGATVGTFEYMSPEQASGGKIGPASDLYSVGVVLYEMLTGQVPFRGENQMQVALQHLHDQPPNFASLGVNVSPALERVVRRALAKDPAQRFQSAEEMLAALNQVSAAMTTNNAPNPQPYVAVSDANSAKASPVIREAVAYQPQQSGNSKILWLLLGLVAIVLLLAVVAGWLLLSPGKSSGITPAVQPTAVAINNTTATVASTTTSSPTNAPVVTSGNTAPAMVPATATLAPTVTPAPTAVPPTATAVPPTVTPMPTNSPIPPTDTPVPTQTNGPLTPAFNPYQLSGAYKRDDGTLYGRPEVALYAAQTQYNQGSISFNLDQAPTGNVYLDITGIDDERADHCTLQITLNGTVIFNAADTFPNAPTNDNGVGGADRDWGQMSVPVPANVLSSGSNTLIFSNTTPGSNIGIPYLLINSFDFSIKNG